MIIKTPYKIHMRDGKFTANNADTQGQKLIIADRKLRDIISIFAHQELSEAQLEAIAYHVEVMMPHREGTANNLQFGMSHLMAGNVNGEYMMTKGHFHQKREAPEIYWGIQGQGLLMMMDETGKTWLEEVEEGSLHHISGHIAHRLINIGDDRLIVGACWPLDAGHDYGSIEETGFGLRVFKTATGIEVRENKNHD